LQAIDGGLGIGGLSFLDAGSTTHRIRMFSFCSVKSLPRKTAKSGDKLSEDPVKVHLLRQTFQGVNTAVLKLQT